MEDTRVWQTEKSLWTEGEENYRALIDDDCLMVVPAEPFIVAGDEAVQAVSDTPRWAEVEIQDGRISRPQEGLIVVAYGVRAKRSDEVYEAFCTSTYRRLGHDDWRVVQHQQTLRPVA